MSANNMQTCDMHARNLPFGSCWSPCTQRQPIGYAHIVAWTGAGARWRPWSECATRAITSLWHIVLYLTCMLYESQYADPEFIGVHLINMDSVFFPFHRSARTCKKSDFIHVIFHLYVLFCFSSSSHTNLSHHSFCIYDGFGRNGMECRTKKN